MHTFGLQGPLSYILRKDAEVPPEADDPLLGFDYFGKSGGLEQEMTARIPLTGSFFKSDNKTVYLHLAEACRGTACESTVKAKGFRQDRRAAFFALIDRHAGDEIYRAIAKTLMNKLISTKWNCKVYSMEKHVSTHIQCFEELISCSEHVTTLVPGEEQRVQYLIDSIECGEQAVQATIGRIRNNMNDMRSSFEKSASALIDVDTYVKGRNRTANIPSLEYTGRGGTGVDLRWHTPQEYRLLTKEQKDELHQWQQSAAGKEVINKSREEYMSRKGGKGKGKGKTVDTPKKSEKWLSKFAKQPKGVRQ